MKLVNRIQRLRQSSRAKSSDKASSIQSSSSCSSSLTMTTAASQEDYEKSAEDLASDYLFNLRLRFHQHLQLLLLSSSSSQEEEDDSSSLHWANYWIQEETEFLNHHQQSLQIKRCGFHFKQSYLRWRKERVLDFLWRTCRDESNMTLDQVKHVFESFCDREIVLLKLHVVNYICFSSSQPPAPPSSCTTTTKRVDVSMKISP